MLCFVSVPSWADTDDCENCKACCYDTAEDLKYEECCELNDKYYNLCNEDNSYSSKGDIYDSRNTCRRYGLPLRRT